MNADFEYHYVKRLTDARLADLRREAVEYRLARSLRAGRAGLAARFGARLRARTARRSAASGAMAGEVAKPVQLARPSLVTDEELRRSA